MEQTKLEKFKTVLMYLLAAVIPVLIVYTYIFIVNRSVDYKDMIDYKINSSIKVSNVALDEELEVPVYITNENPNVSMLIRFKFEIDKELLGDDNASDILKVTNSKVKPLIKVDEYYYLKYSKDEKILLFDKITWLKDKATKDNMQFDIKVEAIKASRSVLKKQWLDSGELDYNNARKLNYLK